MPSGELTGVGERNCLRSLIREGYNLGKIKPTLKGLVRGVGLRVDMRARKLDGPICVAAAMRYIATITVATRYLASNNLYC